MADKSETNAPNCVGFIMDGNRRWARGRGESTLEGHRKGFETLKEVLGWVRDADIKNAAVYALSTENWNRSEEEVSYLLDLFRDVITNEFDELLKENTRVLFAGDRTRFPEDLQKLMLDAEARSAGQTPYTLVICVSYGGRAEIVNATNKLLAKSADIPITEEQFARELWVKDVPDPDLIVRTGGVKRLSGFLSWQSVYSELFFTDTLWPEFSKEEFQSILDEYSARERRYGK